jgi:acyl carrier protein
MDTPTGTQYSNDIRNYIVDNFLFGDGSSLQDDRSFMESGILDSTGVLELVAFLESTFGIKVTDREMVPENLDSVDRAAAFCARKLAETSA